MGPRNALERAAVRWGSAAIWSITLGESCTLTREMFT